MKVDILIKEKLTSKKWEYLKVLDGLNLEEPQEGTYTIGIFGSLKLGTTRLIDNKLVEIKYA
jgi:pantothenate synthetase